jgi:hypothetical protein
MAFQMLSPYLFMLALPRSGSTLLAYVLDSHSRIHVEHEDSGRPHQSIANKEIANLQHKIAAGFAGYLDSLLAPSGKDFLVTTRFFARRHVALIAGALGPQARFIILTRKRMWRTFHDADGKPHIVSRLQLVEFAIGRRWVALNHPHVLVAYEDLVTKPREAFASVCGFIGVEFEPAMLDYANFPHPHLAAHGNEKTRRFGRIVNTLARDEAARQGSATQEPQP